MNARSNHSEGHASACPQTGNRNAQKQDVQKHVSPTWERKHPFHLAPREVHNRPIIVYVTVCTKQRRKILALVRVHDAVVAGWCEASTWLVGRYVIRPDHIHFFCAPNDFESPSLERWMRFWKSRVTRSLGEPAGALWQRHHRDRQLRSGESYSDKWEYVRSNPVRHGLVATEDDWPYQGEFNVLQW